MCIARFSYISHCYPLCRHACLRKKGVEGKRLKKQCVGKNSGNVNSYSGMMNTDSGKLEKVFTMKPESLFTLNQNGCSRWIRIAVHDGPENALDYIFPDIPLTEVVVKRYFRVIQHQ